MSCVSMNLAYKAQDFPTKELRCDYPGRELVNESLSSTELLTPGTRHAAYHEGSQGVMLRGHEQKSLGAMGFKLLWL